MIEASDISRQWKVVDPANNEFIFDVRIFRAADLKCSLVRDGVETVLALNEDYTVRHLENSSNFDDGCVITILRGVEAGDVVAAVRVIPITQELHLAKGSMLPSAELEKAFDRTVMICQQLAFELARCLKLSQIVDGSVTLDMLVADLQRMAAEATAAARSAAAQADAAAQAADRALLAVDAVGDTAAELRQDYSSFTDQINRQLPGKADVDLGNVNSNLDFVRSWGSASDGSWFYFKFGKFALQFGTADTPRQNEVNIYLPIEFADTDYVVNMTVNSASSREHVPSLYNGSDTTYQKKVKSFGIARNVDAEYNIISWMAIGRVN